MNRILQLISVMLLCAFFVGATPIAASAALPGDLDGDGKVTTVDARIILKAASGHISSDKINKSVADMDKDGIITSEDARLILISSTGLISDKDYIDNLLEKGFPASYVEDLLELHKKYPQWKFVPLITNINWSDAVKGERTPHKKQLIENNVQASYKCSCSSCKGVIQESGVWVSASEEAVSYYLDPRNFLNEEYVFQFENNEYDKSQSIKAIESILKPTWMYKSNITYYDGLGNKKTYKVDKKPVKYSEAILMAAKESGLSAYYIASKIVQEVGGTSPTAGGASGKNAPYDGIYNYYNIAAYTGARDGLKWANGSTKAVGTTNIYAKASASSKVVATVSSGKELNYISKSGNFYRVNVTINATKYTGYVSASNIYVGTSYGRPWNNPYKSIYYGAMYIKDSFSEHQYTGYLQKFNVNPESDALHYHEYMANVRAAAFEGRSTYRAYSENGILGGKKIFTIPVFKNMPNGNVLKSEKFLKGSPEITGVTSTANSITIKWNAHDTAVGYQVFRYNKTTGKYERIKVTSGTSYTDTKLSGATNYKYRVRAYRTGKNGKNEFSLYCKAFEATTKPVKPSGLKKVSANKNSIKISWSAVKKCTGYYVYRYDDLSGKYTKVGTVKQTNFSDSGLISGVKYTYKIKAYIKTSNMTSASVFSDTLSVKTTGKAPQKRGVVNVKDILNIRKSPSTNAAVVVQVPNGLQLYILSQSGKWYEVTFVKDGKTYTGYAHSDYIKVSSLKEECPYTEPQTTIESGSKGNGVKWVQWYLYKLGYLSISDIDGDFGPTTMAAVKKFQKDNSIAVDGIVGPGTRTALKNKYGK